MAGAVKSVETFVIAMAGGEGAATTAPETATLTKSQTIGNCVPFVTKRVTTTGASEVENYQVGAWFTSTDTLNVGRDSTSGAIEVEVSVVEFDGARCTVQSDTWNMSSSTTSDTYAIPSAVVLANSFLVFHGYQNSAAQNYYPSHLLRGRLTGVSEITLDRGSADGTADGHWYVVESDSGDFTVETADVQLASVASALDTIAEIDPDTTMLIGSWMATSTAQGSNADNTVDATLTDGTTVTVQRESATGTIDWSGFAVEFTDGTTVQRATITGETGSPMPIDVTLATPVSLTMSTAIVAGNMGSTVTGSFPSTSSADMMDAQCQLTLRDSDAGGDFDELRIQHDVTGGEADNDFSWEVIEWGTGGGEPPATRRVMVIS